jgi:hypothetical protein
MVGMQWGHGAEGMRRCMLMMENEEKERPEAKRD